MKASLGIWVERPVAMGLGRFLARQTGGRLFPRGFSSSRPVRDHWIRVHSLHPRWVWIMDAERAARCLQDLSKIKKSGSAVVVVDEAARFAIPMRSGREDAANALAYRIAALTGAFPVITTAAESLKPLVVGIGCRRGVSARRIDAAVQAALGQVGKTRCAVREVATIDLKAREPGLVAWCRQNHLPLRAFSRQTISSRPWVTRPSAWVRKNIGVDGVCEPCAWLASHDGALILGKTAFSGVTVAVVEEPRPWIS